MNSEWSFMSVANLRLGAKLNSAYEFSRNLCDEVKRSGPRVRVAPRGSWARLLQLDALQQRLPAVAAQRARRRHPGAAAALVGGGGGRCG